jgi:hypothetical protein
MHYQVLMNCIFNVIYSSWVLMMKIWDIVFWYNYIFRNFQLGYLNFSTGLCLGYVFFLLFSQHFFKLLNFLFLCWVISFPSGASWSLYWVMLRLCFLTVKSFWITVYCWNYSELLGFFIEFSHWIIDFPTGLF